MFILFFYGRNFLKNFASYKQENCNGYATLIRETNGLRIVYLYYFKIFYSFETATKFSLI